MYTLETSSGFAVRTTTVEQVASELAQELGRTEHGGLRWSIRTPHGTVVIDNGFAAGPDEASSAHRIDRAHALLVRDQLSVRHPYPLTGLAHTRRTPQRAL